MGTVALPGARVLPLKNVAPEEFARGFCNFECRKLAVESGLRNQSLSESHTGITVLSARLEGRAAVNYHHPSKSLHKTDLEQHLIDLR